MSEAPNDLSKNHITCFLHCANCAKQKPVNKTFREWNRTETGLTPWGIQVFCLRCRLNVAHFSVEALADLVANPPACACCAGGRHAQPKTKPHLWLVSNNEPKGNG